MIWVELGNLGLFLGVWDHAWSLSCRRRCLADAYLDLCWIIIRWMISSCLKATSYSSWALPKNFGWYYVSGRLSCWEACCADFKAMSTSGWSVCAHVYIQPTSWKMGKFSCWVLKVSCGCLCLFYLQRVGKCVSDSCCKARPSLAHVNARPLISWIGSHFTGGLYRRLFCFWKLIWPNIFKSR